MSNEKNFKSTTLNVLGHMICRRRPERSGGTPNVNNEQVQTTSDESIPEIDRIGIKSNLNLLNV
jgi:hypothetical protein